MRTGFLAFFLSCARTYETRKQFDNGMIVNFTDNSSDFIFLFIRLFTREFEDELSVIRFEFASDLINSFVLEFQRAWPSSTLLDA